MGRTEATWIKETWPLALPQVNIHTQGMCTVMYPAAGPPCGQGQGQRKTPPVS